MRFMMMMIPGVYQGGKKIDENFSPSAEAVTAMMKYNEEFAKAGALVSLDGLQPPDRGARVTFSSGKPVVTDGPFSETKEVLGGYWIINVASKAEAVEWARRVPAEKDDVIEVRQIFEMTDFPEEVRQAGESDVVKSAVEQHGS